MVGGPNAVFVPDYHSKYYASDVVDKVWKKGVEGGIWIILKLMQVKIIFYLMIT